MIELLNNNKFVFGPTRRPIVQFSVENRRALQLKDERRERVQAKQELLKNPTNKTLAFESHKQKKQRERNKYEQTKNQTRLSELIKQDKEQEAAAEVEENDYKNVINEMSSKNNNNFPKREKTKRIKTKSKGEIRDKIDRMIAKSRNKPQLPSKTKAKWFE